MFIFWTDDVSFVLLFLASWLLVYFVGGGGGPGATTHCSSGSRCCPPGAMPRGPRAGAAGVAKRGGDLFEPQALDLGFCFLLHKYCWCRESAPVRRFRLGGAQGGLFVGPRVACRGFSGRRRAVGGHPVQNAAWLQGTDCVKGAPVHKARFFSSQ